MKKDALKENCVFCGRLMPEKEKCEFCSQPIKVLVEDKSDVGKKLSEEAKKKYWSDISNLARYCPVCGNELSKDIQEQ